MHPLQRLPAAIAIAGIVAAQPVSAQSVEQFYKSNQIVFLVGHDAGGGYDLYTRTLVRHMMKHVPGQPTAVVKTMPGAGGIRMINFMYATAPRDGTTFGISDRGYVLEPLLGNKAAAFDIARMSALGSIGKQTPACSLWHRARVKTIQDALTQEAVIGGTGPSATTIYPAILNSVLNTKFKIVAGYRGSGEIMLAIERGEAEGVCLSWDTLKTLKPEWLADGKLKPIVQMGLERIAELKDQPTAIELAATDSDKKMLTLYFGPNEMGRPYMGPPDVPKDRLMALRRAFDATMKDEAYLAEAASQKMEVDPMTGDEMEKLIRIFYSSSPEVLQRLNSVLAQNLAEETDRRSDLEMAPAIPAFRFAALALAMSIAIATGVQADVADFYRGKNLRIYVGYGPGAGYDVYARLLARHISRHMPGQPVPVVHNMPGAASLTMVNYMYNAAARDGTAIGLPARGLFIEPMLGNQNARFEARKFTWIGSMSKDVALCFAWHTSGILKIEDTMKREVLLGSAATTSSSYQMPVLVNALLGTKFKPLLGYVDAGGVGLAMERGEVEAYCSFTWGSMKSARPTWIEQKLVNILLQLATSKSPDLPHVPLVMEYARDEAALQALNFVFADQEMGRPVFAPPDVPADRVAALRRALDATLRDKEFLADAARMSIDIDPIDGKAVEQILASIYATPQGVVERVKRIYSERGQTK